MTLALEFDRIIQEDTKAKRDAALVEYEKMKRSLPGSYGAMQAFNPLMHGHNDTQRAQLVGALILISNAVKTCKFDYQSMRGYTCSMSYSERSDLGKPCTGYKEYPIAGIGVFVDMGLILRTPGYAHDAIRVTGDPEEIHDTTGVPQFVVVMTNRQINREIWQEAKKFFLPEYQALCAKYDALVAEREPEAQKTAARHAHKLGKARERAQRPEVVAKKNNEARDKARASLSKLLASSCKSILDDWTPEQLQSYLDLCKKHEYVLNELMRWASKCPLGSKHITLEDVQAALELAKVTGVMES